MDRRLALVATLAAVACLVLPAAAQAAPSWSGSWLKVAGGAGFTPRSSVEVSFYGTCTYEGWVHTELLPMLDGDVAIGSSWASLPVDDSGYEQDGKYMTSWASGASKDMPLTGGDGPKHLELKFWNQAIEGFSPTYSASIILDTRGPKTVAPYRLTAKRGGYVTVSYQVDDTYSPTASVSLELRSSAGKKLKAIPLGEQATGKLFTYLLKVNLGKGKYRYAVLATDLAGNKASKVGVNNLTVR